MVNWSVQYEEGDLLESSPFLPDYNQYLVLLLQPSLGMVVQDSEEK